MRGSNYTHFSFKVFSVLETLLGNARIITTCRVSRHKHKI